MSDFDASTLASLVYESRPITYGIVQPGPDISPDGIPLIRGKDYSSGKVSTEGLYHVLPAIDLPYSRSKVLGGDLLFSIVGYVGLTAQVPAELTGANITQTTARLSIDPNKAESTYVFHFLSSPHYRPNITRYEKGSAQPGLNLSDVQKLKIKHPKLPQQRRIATILSTMDEVIEVTEKLVEKHQQIKAGLMHDLFTRGLWTLPELARGDHKGTPAETTAQEGQLRPTPEEAPGLYQKSPLGLIPKTWIAGPLRYFVPQVRYGVSVSMDEDSSGVPVLRMNNLGNGRIDVSDIKYSGSIEARSLLLRNGDVIFNRTNSLEHVGKTAIWREELDAASFASYLVRLDADPLKMSPEFLTQWLNLPRTQLAIRRYATPGVHQVNINPTSLRQVDCAAPTDLDEQRAIHARIEGLDHHRLTNDQHLAKLRQQKQGLMHDLLTGRVRIE